MADRTHDGESCPRCGSVEAAGGWYCHDCHPFVCPDCLADIDDPTVAAVQRGFEQNEEVLASYSPRELAGIAVAAARAHEYESNPIHQKEPT